MTDFVDYCGKDPTPLPCTQNLGIPRIKMPQINNHTELDILKQISKELNYNCKDKLLKNIKNKNIFTSQKEINETKAKEIPIQIRKKKSSVPVIMLKNKKNEYMVVDGHHRWLAHYLKNANLNILELNTNQNNLEKNFYELDHELKKHKINFHKGHSINSKSRKSQKKQKDQKRQTIKSNNKDKKSNNKDKKSKSQKSQKNKDKKKY